MNIVCPTYCAPQMMPSMNCETNYSSNCQFNCNNPYPIVTTPPSILQPPDGVNTGDGNYNFPCDDGPWRTIYYDKYAIRKKIVILFAGSCSQSLAVNGIVILSNIYAGYVYESPFLRIESVAIHCAAFHGACKNYVDGQFRQCAGQYQIYFA